MIIRALDTDSDWEFGNGKANYLTNNDAIGLNIRTRLLSWVGDCFFDLLAGVDWTNRLGSKNQRALLEAELRRVILQSFGVTGIVELSTTLNGRNFSASYTVNTIYSKNYVDTVFREI